MIKLYNSLTNRIEEFIPIKEKELSMYVCGSTVYNEMHIGNSRPVIFFDVVSRFFKYLGYKVTFVSNFTDIDDKIINKAKAEGVTETVIANRYIGIIKETYHLLNCLPHDYNPRVIENMEEIIAFIKKLVDNGSAYVVDGDVYFDVLKDKEYGILSGQSVDNLLVGARLEENTKKHNPIDFNLWKETTEGIKFSSPWSMGRPGWHTECVVMINNIFNNKIDIHGGGSDLKFPHHDNEIAQSVCANNHMIANYWMHNGRIDLDGVKMSKSLGNIVWAKELVEKLGYVAYRLIILNVPYRQPLNYRDEAVNQAINDGEKLRRTYLSLYRKIEVDYLQNDYKTEITNNELLELRNEFINAMSSDFNTANAITTIVKLTKFINNYVRQKEQDIEILKQTLSLFDEFLFVLGLEMKVKPLSEEDKKIVLEWKKARNNKDFNEADRLRNLIQERNIEI